VLDARKPARWPADDAGRHSPSHSRDECRKPALGRSADTRRITQAWHRRRTDHGRKVYGEEEATAVAGLEDLPSQSCRRHRIDGSVPGPDDFVSAIVRISDPAPQSSQAYVAGCNRASERRMDYPATDRGMRVATGAPIYHSRPGSRLRRCLCPTTSSDGHTRSTDRTTLTMAEWMCGEADRIDPAGLP